MWCTLAIAEVSARSSDGIAEQLGAVAQAMTLEEVDAAGRRVREWTPTPER